MAAPSLANSAPPTVPPLLLASLHLLPLAGLDRPRILDLKFDMEAAPGTLISRAQSPVRQETSRVSAVRLPCCLLAVRCLGSNNSCNILAFSACVPSVESLPCRRDNVRQVFTSRLRFGI
jgi:hypothetical protein